MKASALLLAAALCSRPTPVAQAPGDASPTAQPQQVESAADAKTNSGQRAFSAGSQASAAKQSWLAEGARAAVREAPFAGAASGSLTGEGGPAEAADAGRSPAGEPIAPRAMVREPAMDGGVAVERRAAAAEPSNSAAGTEARAPGGGAGAAEPTREGPPPRAADAGALAVDQGQGPAPVGAAQGQRARETDGAQVAEEDVDALRQELEDVRRALEEERAARAAADQREQTERAANDEAHAERVQALEAERAARRAHEEALELSRLERGGWLQDASDDLYAATEELARGEEPAAAIGRADAALAATAAAARRNGATEEAERAEQALERMAAARRALEEGDLYYARRELAEALAWSAEAKEEAARGAPAPLAPER